MTSYAYISKVPSADLAYFVGRWIAIAQIETNAHAGREHAEEQYALALAASHVLDARGSESSARVKAAVSALGLMIQQEFQGADLGVASETQVLAAVNRGWTL